MKNKERTKFWCVLFYISSERSNVRIPINKEIEEAYKDQFVKGFTMRETGYIALSLGIVFGVGYLVWYFFKLPINLCAYIGIPFAIPTVIIGFKKFQGLTLTEYLNELRYESKTKELFYDADELPESMKCYRMKKEIDKKKRKRG